MNTSWIDPTGFTSNALGKGNQAPPTPDFTGAAQAQGAANVETARLTGQMSNPNINTPQGSQTVTWNGDQPTVNRTFSPDQQHLYDQQMGISQNLGDIAGQGLSRVGTTMGSNFDMSNVPGRQSSVAGGPIQTGVAGAGDSARRAVEQAMYQRATARLDPRFQQSDDNLQSNLVAQGLHPGTEAYDRAMRNQTFAKNDAYSSAANDAITAGGVEQARQFGMNLGAGNFANQAQQQGFGQGVTNANLTNQQRQQAIQEEAYQRQLPLQELNALRTGAQPNMPQFQNFSGTQVAGTPIFAGAQAQSQSANDIYNAQVGQQNAQMGAMGQMGAAALPFLFSDRRLKRKIRRLGTLASGLPFYEFEYVWGGGKKLGVMAQEVMLLFPAAVRSFGGWLAVDYGRIY